MKNKAVPLSDAINKYLYEQEDAPAEDEESDENIPKESNKTSKEKEIKDQEISSIEKSDLEDDEEFEEGDVAVSVKLNNNTKTAGEIKLIPFSRLSTMTKIEDLISLFNIEPEKISGAFEDQLAISLQSPASGFESEKYIIRLMDGLGEIVIDRDNFHKTISKQGSGVSNLGQATQKELGGDEEEEQQVDLSYLEILNYEFKRFIKDEFFARLLQRA
jgi:hypothetical protein